MFAPITLPTRIQDSLRNRITLKFLCRVPHRRAKTSREAGNAGDELLFIVSLWDELFPGMRDDLASAYIGHTSDSELKAYCHLDLPDDIGKVAVVRARDRPVRDAIWDEIV
jgi:hypothetical protein